MTEPLKPCPFCGHVGIWGIEARFHPVLAHRHQEVDDRKVFAYCSKCFATGPVADDLDSSWQKRVE